MRKAFAVALAACSTTGLVGQVANNTTLVGTVRDSSGAVLPNAHVRAVDEATQVTYEGTTNSHGDYLIPFVAPGTYDITAEEQGFQEVVEKGVLVVVNQAARTDFGLKVGEATTSVTVSADTPPMPTDDATLGVTSTQSTARQLQLAAKIVF